MENLFDFYTIEFYSNLKRPLNGVCEHIGMDKKNIQCKVTYGQRFPVKNYSLTFGNVPLQLGNYEEVLEQKETLAREIASLLGVSVAVKYHARD